MASTRTSIQILPRLLRFRDAPAYLGMDRNRFNSEVRPFVAEIRIGRQGIAFDRLDLDAWAEQYKSRNGRPGQPIGDQLWDASERPASPNVVGSGMSTNKSTGGEFAKAVARINSKKRNAS